MKSDWVPCAGGNLTEAAFLRELEIFRHDVEGATQLFYAHLAVHATMAQHEQVADRLNEASLFWSTCQYALQSSTFIVLGRIFDQKSRHNIDHLIGIALRDPSMFSESALAQRKRGAAVGQNGWMTI